MIGTAVGQAASVALAPVLTRLYTAEEFGFLSVYTAALAILGVTAALGLDIAIPLAASEIELANLLAGSGIAVVLSSGIAGLTMWLLPAPALAQMWLGPLDAYRYLLPAGLACIGAYYVMVAAATWTGGFADIARTRVTQGFGGPLSQVALGVAGTGEAGLAIGFIVGQSSGVFLLLARVLRDRPDIRAMISFSGIRAAIARYSHFPLFTSWTRLIDMAGSGTVLYLLFSAYYATDVVGYMFLGERVIARPLLMVSSSLHQVYAGEAGRVARDDPSALGRRFRQVVPGQLLFALAWILPVNMLAYRAVPVLFGGPWLAAVPYLHALSLSYMALTVVHPVSTTLQMLNRQMAAAAWQMSRLLLLIAALILSHHFGLAAVDALWVCSAVQAAACTGMLATMAICIHRRETSSPAKTAALPIEAIRQTMT